MMRDSLPLAGALTTAGQNGYFWYLSQTSIPTSNDRGSTIKKKGKKKKKNQMSQICLTQVQYRQEASKTPTPITVLVTPNSNLPRNPDTQNGISVPTVGQEAMTVCV